MRIELQSGALRLAPGQTLRGIDALGSTISCNEGSVWITEENQRKDVVLGRMVDGLRVVESGLEAGDQVVVTGVQKIFFPGMPLEAKPLEPAPASPAAADAVAALSP